MFRRLSTIIGYLLFALVVIGGTFVLVAFSQGYSYDTSHHRFVRRGLVLFSSTPSGAQITKDGKPINHNTSYRASYDPGKYAITIAKDGYHTWTKTLEVVAGQVTYARYVILLPETLLKATVATTPTAYVVPTASVDHHHLAYATAPTATQGAAVWVADMPGGAPTKRFSLPIATAATPAETIVGLDWSDDASHLLVVSQAAAGRVYRVIAADGSNPLNLTDKYKYDFTGIRFAPNDWHQLYWVSADSSFRRLDLSAQAVSNVLADQVTQFSYAGDHVLYIQTTPLGRSLLSFSLRDIASKSVIVQALPASPSYVMSYSNYQNNDDVVIIPSITRDAIIYSGVFGSSPVSTIVAHGVDNATFSPDGHFVALYSPTNLITYDLQLSTLIYNVNYVSPALSAPLTGLSWFDPYHLILHLGNEAVFSDFDGTNQVDIAPAMAGLTPFAANDAKSVYTLEPFGVSGQKLVNITIR